jgi:MerR family mercuric resistance operon transcriptional regulator
MVAKRTDGGLTIGQLSRRTGVNIETIRYYERIRLLPPPPRSRSGHRVYEADSLRTLAFIKRARELDFGLSDIRSLLSLRGSNGTCMAVKAIAARQLNAVRAKMRNLQDMEEILAATVARCSGDKVSECAVLDVLDTGSLERFATSSRSACLETGAPALPSIARNRP